MPIGPITPGSPVEVTPDPSPTPYTSIQAPSATMPVVAADIQALTLALLNSIRALAIAFETQALSVTNVFDVRTGQLHAEVGAVQIGKAGDTITVTGSQLALGNTGLTLGAGGSMSSLGTNVFGSGSQTEFDGTAVLKTSNGGRFRWDTRNKTLADYTADGTNGYEDILPDLPTTGLGITLANTGAAIGQRKRFNAQKVTGAHYWTLAYGLRQWPMRNATAHTVIIEFVFDGSGWVVDDWEEGGNVSRDG